MWNRKELKRSAREALKSNYWRCVIISLLILALAGGLNFPRPDTAMEGLSQLSYKGVTHTQIVNDVARSVFGQNQDLWAMYGQVSNSHNGALASIFNNATASGSFIFGLLNALNQLFFKDAVWPAIIIAVGAAATFVYYLFVKNVLVVGQFRFYLENRRYTGSPISRLLYIYQTGYTRRVAWIMFLRALFTVLWSFTIVGGVIKFYAYRMVPLLVAENPNLSRKDAFRISAGLMRGNKWPCFLLDLSFAGWYLLSFLSFRILGVLAASPYHSATYAELYMRLRGEALAKYPALDAYCNDSILDMPERIPVPYPADSFTLPEKLSRQWLTADCHRRYEVTDIILLFFSFCFIGYAWEVLYYLVEIGQFVNRGTLYGPWLPIYGCGGVAVILLLRRFIDRPVLTFFLVIGLCGTIEYFTSWFLETFKHTKWWDYTGYFLNLNGRICLEGLLVFGIAGTLGIYMLAPMLDAQIARIPKPLRVALCVVLSAAFLADLGYSFFHPNMAAGVAA